MNSSPGDLNQIGGGGGFAVAGIPSAPSQRWVPANEDRPRWGMLTTTGSEPWGSGSSLCAQEIGDPSLVPTSKCAHPGSRPPRSCSPNWLRPTFRGGEELYPWATPFPPLPASPHPQDRPPPPGPGGVPVPHRVGGSAGTLIDGRRVPRPLPLHRRQHRQRRPGPLGWEPYLGVWWLKAEGLASRGLPLPTGIFFVGAPIGPEKGGKRNDQPAAFFHSAIFWWTVAASPLPGRIIQKGPVSGAAICRVDVSQNIEMLVIPNLLVVRRLVSFPPFLSFGRRPGRPCTGLIFPTGGGGGEVLNSRAPVSARNRNHTTSLPPTIN